MLRPERMSRVSVTGSKRVMDEAIEAVHELQLVHVTDYDGRWEGFDPGDPISGADAASDKLVTIRALQSTLGVEEDDAGPRRIVTDEALETELEEVRQEVNELDDRRDELRSELGDVRERIDAVEPFAALGIDLDLLSGYDSLAVAVGHGDPDAVRDALARESAVTAWEVFADDGVVATFAAPADAPLDDALVGADFARQELPADAEGSPESYVAELRAREQQLESKLDTVEEELGDLKLDVAGFLLAAEETLAIQVQKREAPLSFATTENAFVAEGWIPTERFADLEDALSAAVGDHVQVEELEQAAYDDEGVPAEREEVEPEGGHGAAAGGAAATADGGADDPAVRSDGGTVAADRPMSGDDPPVVQDNPAPADPFELLVEVVNLPNYREIDPTMVVFLTFPAFFGFMIGDVGYGLLYLAVGYLLWDRTDSDALRSLGGIALWSGGFTVLFGILYGEIFGLHVLGDALWAGSPPIHKGLQPHYGDYALLWLVGSLLIGVVHLTVGWVFDFYQNLDHGFADAMYESGSWLLMMFGIWAWIFAGAFGSAPSLVYGPGSVFAGNPIALGFTGFPDPVGLAGLAAFGLGFVLLLYGEPVEVVEFLDVLVNVLSYTRIAAVLLAKAGMAFVVNLLFFGVYVTGHGQEATWHFALGHMPTVGDTVHGHEVTEIMFGGLLHGGVAAILFGLVVLVVGHLLVMALGITSAGLQSIRLEYVEFFQKFYEGGGDAYEPFGHERRHTTED